MLGQVRLTVADRGYYRRDEFLEVGDWKSPRSKTYLTRNSAEDIEDITRIALAAPERLKYRILDLLAGVGIPMASALLTVDDSANKPMVNAGFGPARRPSMSADLVSEVGPDRWPFALFCLAH